MNQKSTFYNFKRRLHVYKRGSAEIISGSVEPPSIHPKLCEKPIQSQGIFLRSPPRSPPEPPRNPPEPPRSPPPNSAEPPAEPPGAPTEPPHHFPSNYTMQGPFGPLWKPHGTPNLSVCVPGGGGAVLVVVVLVVVVCVLWCGGAFLWRGHTRSFQTGCSSRNFNTFFATKGVVPSS